MKRKIALIFVLAVALTLVTSGMAIADTIALWHYNGNASFSSSTAWSTTTASNPVSANSGAGTQDHVNSMRWGYNDGNQPSGGAGDWSGDPAGGGTTTASRAEDDRYRFEAVTANSGLKWTVNTAGYTNVGISLGLFTSTNLATTTGSVTSFLLGYSTNGGSTWTDTTYTYTGNSVYPASTDFVLTGLPSGVNAFHLIVNGDPSGSQIMTVDYVNVQGTSAVPIPAAAWLLGSGLLGLVAIRRRMKK
jgi:hypothetical protein